MKKILFTLLAVICFSFVTYAAESTATTNEAPTCIEVGNVSAYIDGSQVVFDNYNDYKVTVRYKVIGYKVDGGSSIVGSGSVVLTKTQKGARKNFRTLQEIAAYGVEISVQKCN